MSTRRYRWLVPLVALALMALAIVWRARPQPRGERAADAPNRAPAVGRARVGVSSSSIAGQVRDHTGAAVAAAAVCASAAAVADTSDRPPCTTTDGAGRYHLTGLGAGVYVVTADADAWAPTRWRGAGGEPSLPLADGERRDGIDLVMAVRGSVITGRVLDASGGPIAGAVVATAVRGSMMFYDTAFVAGSFATADDDGRFSLRARAGTLALFTRASGYLDDLREAAAPVDGVIITLTPGASIDGIVIDADGAPVADAVVTANPGQPSVRTDGAGRFHVSGLAPGRYRPTAKVRYGHATTTTDVLVTVGESVSGVQLILRPAGAVVGTVVLADESTPCPQASVRLEDARVQGLAESVVEADDHGAVVFEGVPAGRYEVTVSCPRGSRTQPPPVTVVAGTTTEAHWTVEAGAVITGRVTDTEGVPITGAEVGMLIDLSPAPPVSTDADGRYRLTTEDGRRIVLLARAPGFVAGRAPATAVTSDAVTTIDLRLARGGGISGVVRDASGAPVPGVAVVATLRRGTRGTTWTGGDGSYALSDLLAGDWSVAAYDDALVPSGGVGEPLGPAGSVAVVVGASANLDLVVAGRTGQITGRVTTTAGAPVADAWVTAFRNTGARAPSVNDTFQRIPSSGTVPTAADGSFVITGLTVGGYELHAHRPGGAERTLSGVAVGATVTITLEEPGAIVGTVEDPAAGTPPDVIVVHYDTNAYRQSRRTFYGTAGRFELPRLIPGPYELRVDSVSQTAAATVVVAPGETVQVALTFRPAPALHGRVVDVETGRPVANVKVLARPALSLPVGGIGSAPTGADGAFRIDHAPTGDLELEAVDLGSGAPRPYVGPTTTAHIGANEVLDVGVLELVRARVGRGERAGTLGFAATSPDHPPASRIVEVTRVASGSSAAAQGLRVGDQIVAIDGIKLAGRERLASHLLDVSPSTTVTLRLARGLEVTITASAE